MVFGVISSSFRLVPGRLLISFRLLEPYNQPNSWLINVHGGTKMRRIIATISMLIMLSLVFVPAGLGISIEPYCGTEGEYKLEKDESINIGTKNIRVNNVVDFEPAEGIGAVIAVIDGTEYNYNTLYGCDTKVIGDVKIEVIQIHLAEDESDNSWVLLNVLNEEDFTEPLTEPVDEPEAELEPVCFTTNYLLEGEMNSYKVGDNVYDVFLTSVYHDDVKFNVNGENTPKLNERDSYRLTDGVDLNIYKIIYQEYAGGVHSASFCFDGMAGVEIVEEVVEDTEVTEEPLLCGGSYGGDGYYSACVGDVVKHETGIKFEVRSFTESGLKLKIVGTEKILIFENLNEVIKFKQGDITYKVEYNFNEGSRVTIFVSHSTEEGVDAPEPVIIDREVSRVTEEVIVEDLECGGCMPGESCLPFGTRLLEESTPVYCDLEGNLEEQKPLGKSCQNNYECLSNQCSNGQCIDLSGQLKETQNILEKIFAWIRGMFGLVS